MPILRPAFRGLFVAAALIAGIDPAGAAPRTASFDFYVAGIKAGTATLITDQTAKGYSAKSRVDAAGLLGFFVSFFYDGRSTGRIEGDGTVVPVEFEALSRSPRGDKTTRIDWKNGTPNAVSVVPPRSSPPDPAKQGGALDPVSAGFAVLRDAPPDQICDKTVNVYDGSRLSRLRLDPPVARDGGYSCAGAYSRIEGEAHTLSSQREFAFQLIFVTDGGLARLDRVETRTNFGLAVLERRGLSAAAMFQLPIEPILGALGEALRDHGRAVLRAPPGAGKTTRVPLYLLEQGLVAGRILMLEPRRVAARAAAERLAAGLGEAPGGRVGYRIRGESVAGTRIEVVTEGILTRMIQSDPELPGVGCLIFDEFHERGLQADLGLALALEIGAALRPDLMLLVMSATLDAAPVAALIGDAQVLTAEGRAWPVETRWLDQPWSAARQRLEAAVAELTLRALAETEGGLLVFLPGQAEIARAAALLAPRLPEGVVVQPLHGGLPFARQRAALAPLTGARKLVLATAIAETSLTIPDVRVVIDAGRARRARYDPGSGMSRLITERVTRAEAEQRRGRAGRVAPGWCYRLWSRGEEGALAAFPPPEIASADLTGLALELALWGAASPEGMGFLTPPPAPALAEARALLTELGALDVAGHVTEHGRALARLPLHPRLGHMMLTAASHGAGGLAADLAALLQARDPLRGRDGRASVDLAPRLAALRDPRAVEAEHPVAVDRAAIEALRAEARRLRATLRDGDGPGLTPGAVLSLAYPDRVGKRRPGVQPRYLLAGGKGAALPETDPLAAAPLIVAADLDGDPREAAIRLALPVTEADIRDLHADRLRREDICGWSRRDRAVLSRRRLMLGALVLKDRPWPDAPPERVAAALIEGIRELGLEALPWTPGARRLAARVEWLRGQGVPDLPDFSQDGLMDSLPGWLAPRLAGMARAADLARLDLRAALEARLDWDARQRLDRLAPAEITAPTGTRLPIDYSGAAPGVAVRLQEMFGLTRHPTIGPAAIPLVIELLSPGQQPVQTTADLPGFWANSYADVRRDLRGRYPRHPWPEDPAAADPTRRAKPRGT